MNITKTIVTTTLEKSTDIADYVIEHMSENAALTRIHVTVKGRGSESILGSIHQEHGSTGGEFYLMSDISKYFAEFNAFLVEIQSSIAPQQESTNNKTTKI